MLHPPVTVSGFIPLGLVLAKALTPPIRPIARSFGNASSPSFARRRCRRQGCRGPMPPPITRVAASLEASIDRAWTANPNPGQDRRGASAQSRRIQQRHPRSVRARRRRRRQKLPGDETADGSFDNFADVAVDFDRAPRAVSLGRPRGHAARRRPAALRPRPSIDSRFRCTWSRTISRATICRSDRAAALAIRYDFPADGEYVIKVRLRRQYQDYVMGMGWPQQLDVRLDGALRQALHRWRRGRKGRPAAASYAGDGEPGFAGDPEWESTCRTVADAGLEVRMHVKARPHVCRCLVREADVGARRGCRSRCSAAGC